METTCEEVAKTIIELAGKKSSNNFLCACNDVNKIKKEFEKLDPTNARNVKIYGNVDEINPDGLTELTVLQCSCCHNCVDVGKLVNLTTLDCSHCKNIAGVEKLVNLVSLWSNCCPNITKVENLVN